MYTEGAKFWFKARAYMRHPHMTLATYMRLGFVLKMVIQTICARHLSSPSLTLERVPTIALGRGHMVPQAPNTYVLRGFNSANGATF
jgi:hypothetical protein